MVFDRGYLMVGLNSRMDSFDANLHKPIDYQNEMKTSVKKKDQTICDAKYKWKGSWYSNDFKRDMHKMLDAEKSYLDSLNRKIDCINDKITYFERERAKHQNLLQKIWTEIKSVGREIENLGN